MTLKTKAFGDIITFTRASGGGRFNAQGVYEWLPANEPRIDYDPVTGECRGLLIEEQRTNVVPNSDTLASFYNVLGTDAQITRTPGYGQFRGMPTIRLQMSRPKISSEHSAYIVFGHSSPDSSPHTISLFARTLDGTTKEIGFSISAGESITVTPEWKFFAASKAVLTKAFRLGLIGAATPTLEADIEVCAVQFEAGAFPTSYIPTVASQVTRSADVASVNTLSPWHNASEGTFVVVGANIPNAVPGTNRHIFGLSDWTFNNFVAIRKNSSGLQFVVTTAGVTVVNIQRTSPTGIFKAALSLQDNNTAAAFGGTVNIDSSNTVPPASVLRIGSLAAAGQYANGHIQRIEYYPRRLSNTELQEITA